MIATAARYLYRYVKYQRGKSAPLWCTFSLTENCSCRCQYCDFWWSKKTDLTTDQIGGILRRLVEGGVNHVAFSGGEPLLRRDVAEILAIAARLGISSTLVTSGTAGKQNVYEEMMRAGLRSLAFSLDGSTAEIHESFRKNCPYAKVIRSIERACEARARFDFSTTITLNTVVHKGNHHDIENIHRLRERLGLDRNTFQPVWSVYEDPEFMEKYGFTAADRALVEEIRDVLKRIGTNLDEYFDLMPSFYGDYREVMKTPCYAGRAFIHVDGKGNVLPCSMIAHPLGNLLDSPLSDILERPESLGTYESCSQYDCPRCTVMCYIERNLIIDSVRRNPLKSLRYYRERLRHAV